METPIEEINQWIADYGDRALAIALTQLAVANGLIELANDEIALLKAQLEQQETREYNLTCRALDTTPEGRKFLAQLEQAKAALAELADSKRYDWDFYGIRFAMGDKYDENYVKPWDYAARILRAEGDCVRTLDNGAG